MEERINVAELLKDCPKGMELDCITYNGVATLGEVTNNIYYPISINISCNNENICVVLTEYGQLAPTMFNKCVIFPKGKTTWEGFQRPFKDGDILFVSASYSWVFIYKEGKNKGSLYKHVAIPYHHNSTNIVYGDNLLCCKQDISEIRFATEEEKATLFDAIKANGFQWNEETKTLEELVESKEDTDDRVVISGICFDRENYADEVELHLGNYEIEIRDGKTYAVFKSKTKTLEKIEPKSTLSEEDEADLNNIIWLCNNCIKGSETTWIPSQATRIKHLIETIKEKGLAQQTSAWSEEDEKILDIITSVLRANFEPTERFIECEDYMNVNLINWLKSLKDRCTWKPSDKQMEQLGWIAEQNKNNMIGQELMTLYNDLKKLKE